METQTPGTNNVRDFWSVAGRARIDDRRFFAPDQDIGVDEAEINPQGFGRREALRVSDPGREIAATESDPPSLAAES